MPLHFAAEPVDGARLVKAGLARLANRPQPLPAGLVAAEVRSGQLTPPHAVYDLRADEVAAGGGLETAHATAIRYLVETPNKTIAAAEVQTDSSGKATLLANLNFGPFVDATSRALTHLATLSQVAKGSYEARLLRFSAIPAMAIWLKAGAGGQDMVYPLAPAPAGLAAETPCSPADYLAAVLPIAKKRAAKTTVSVP
jgi:hypothetical protein